MCVLTYYPLREGGAYLTHNRDEHYTRSEADLPRQYTLADQVAVFPRDPKGGGTWFAHHKNIVACLLNGAFEAHISTPPYRQSRGLVIPALLASTDIEVFFQTFEANDFEPFTLVIYQKTPAQLKEVVWDGSTLHQKTLSCQETHIWSSSTLYNSQVKSARKTLFRALSAHILSADDLWHFHQCNEDNLPEKSLLIGQPNPVRTVAIAQIDTRDDEMQIRYWKVDT